MPTLLQEHHPKKHLALGKARETFQKLREKGLGDKFCDMTERQIIQVLKQTREKIWQEKLAARS